MTAREMQIEMERRIQLIDPSLIAEDKVTSDTLFSFLNAYTKRYVKQAYLMADSTQQGSRAQKNSIDVIKSLVTRQLLLPEDNSTTDEYTVSFKLPDDYYLYIRSNSLTSSTYNNQSLNESKPIPNQLVDVEQASEIITTPFNQIILRNPRAILHQHGNDTCLNIIHDTFTKVNSVDLIYYRLPKLFNILNVDNVTILDHCELPESVHMEIVEGAVEMFITEAKYRLNIKQD